MKLVVCLLLVALLRCSIQLTPAPFNNCNDNLDVVLVADASSSVSGSFPIIQAAVNTFVTEITNNNPNIRIGIVFFNDSVRQQLLTTNALILQNFVNSQTGGQGLTRTDLGITAAVDLLRNQGNPKSIVVLTDAISTQPHLTIRAADNARADNIRMFAIAVNVDAVFQRELVDITNDVNKIFTLNSDAEIRDTVIALGKSLCAYTACSGCNANLGTRLEPHPTRCDKFYICESSNVWGNHTLKAHEKNCPIGTLWHRRYQTCVRSWQALSDPHAGCSYCDNTRTTFQVADYCQIYYECGINANNQAMLNVQCCATGLTYDFNAGRCVQGACDPRFYEDKVSCRGYYSCDGVTSPPTWQRNCCQGGQGYIDRAQKCEANGNCRESCESATLKVCDDYEPHPSDKCKFRLVRDKKEMDCPAGTSYNQTACACVRDESCSSAPLPSVCQPDVALPLSADQTSPWGFNDFRGHWIGVHDVVYENGVAVLGRAVPGFMIIPFYSNKAFVQNTTLFRVSVMDDFPVNAVPRVRVVLDNSPCPGGFCEAGETPSVWITMSESSQEINFGVRTVNGMATVDLPYQTTPGLRTWKELTLRYVQSPGLLEAGIKEYTIVNGQRQWLGPPRTLTSTATSGRILISDCGIRIGQSVNPNFGFVGSVDDILIYDSCKQTVPDVDADNPTGLGLIP